ncbi:hypothetical protein [Aneurinibacillus aneurinilyticus]
MVEYKSRYLMLTFYVNGSARTFQDGRYTTNDKDEIAMLDSLKDVERVVTSDDKPQARRKAKGTR